VRCGGGATRDFSARFRWHSNQVTTADPTEHVAGPNDTRDGRTVQCGGGQSTAPVWANLRRAGELAETEEDGREPSQWL
jgi:hypothetical protein